jgi:hypothetical protein
VKYRKRASSIGCAFNEKAIERMLEMKFKKKPIVIDAIRWTGKEADIGPILDWVKASSVDDGMVGGPGIGYVPVLGTLDIPTLEGTMTAQPGDWIIKGIKGEVYLCKPDIFEAFYERTYDD